MIAGIDFPSRFTTDNFTSRRTTGHNMYDPECLITGAEIDAGFTYTNSARDWQSEVDYYLACVGYLTPIQILSHAPRVLINAPSLNSVTIEDYQETI